MEIFMQKQYYDPSGFNNKKNNATLWSKFDFKNFCLNIFEINNKYKYFGISEFEEFENIAKELIKKDKKNYLDIDTNFYFYFLYLLDIYFKFKK